MDYEYSDTMRTIQLLDWAFIGAYEEIVERPSSIFMYLLRRCASEILKRRDTRLVNINIANDEIIYVTGELVGVSRYTRRSLL